MIGGIDIRLRTSPGRQAMEVAVRAIRQLWPHAVFENGNTGDRYDYFWQVPFGELDELFVYRDPEVARVWDERGAIAEARNTMIHVLQDAGLITIVVDERDQEMETAINAIRSALNDPILAVTASLRRAAA